jgi:hypothetical protein
MRRLAIMTSIIGAVAFAALLAWGLTLGSSTVKAQTPTPTATETATVVATETATAEATATAVTYCDPVIPTTYTGIASSAGQPVPDGTTISAVDSDGVVWATDETAAGRYVLTVPATMPVSPPCFPGGTISFTCDSTTAAETSADATGAGAKDLNLTCGALVTPTPTVVPTPTVPPTPKATPSPTPTPTVLPPTGMGGMSGDAGFMWWPLALAAAALTSVAGLFTARWARR